jgi:hypothetical protein
LRNPLAGVSAPAYSFVSAVIITAPCRVAVVVCYGSRSKVRGIYTSRIVANMVYYHTMWNAPEEKLECEYVRSNPAPAVPEVAVSANGVRTVPQPAWSKVPAPWTMLIYFAPKPFLHGFAHTISSSLVVCRATEAAA